MKFDAAAVGALFEAPKDVTDWLGAAVLAGAGSAEAAAVAAGVPAAEGRPNKLVLPVAEAPILVIAVVAMAIAGGVLKASGAVPVSGAALVIMPNPLKLGEVPAAGAEAPPPKEKVAVAATAVRAVLGALVMSDPAAEWSLPGVVALKVGLAVSASLGLELLTAAAPNLKAKGGAAAGAAAGAAGKEGRTGEGAGAVPKVDCPRGVAALNCSTDCVGPVVEQHSSNMT